jgi:hypothetical protein
MVLRTPDVGMMISATTASSSRDSISELRMELTPYGLSCYTYKKYVATIDKLIEILSYYLGFDFSLALFFAGEIPKTQPRTIIALALNPD